MIIDDARRMAFVHIPKCGGTSIRKQLAPYDSTNGAFFPVIDHPALGKIHSAHIPLAYLREHFPNEFGKVQSYNSFAIVREPLDRFASATFQRIKEFKRVPPGEITPKMALAEARKVIEWLELRGTFCDFDFTHFSRQIDFVALDGERVVKNLYSIDDMAGFAADLRDMCGIELDPERRENVNFAHPHVFARTFRRVLKPIYSRVTTWEFREKLLWRMKRATMGKSEPLYEPFRHDGFVTSFVERHYADDIVLYDSVCSSRAPREADVAPRELTEVQ